MGGKKKKETNKKTKRNTQRGGRHFQKKGLQGQVCSHAHTETCKRRKNKPPAAGGHIKASLCHLPCLLLIL